jgi:hypothetical protein
VRRRWRLSAGELEVKVACGLHLKWPREEGAGGGEVAHGWRRRREAPALEMEFCCGRRPALQRDGRPSLRVDKVKGEKKNKKKGEK